MKRYRIQFMSGYAIFLSSYHPTIKISGKTAKIVFHQINPDDSNVFYLTEILNIEEV